jgi:hypothetical protein
MAGLTNKQQAFVNEYYVYLLKDPRDMSIFYIGKGKGKRMFTHVANARKGKIDNVKKYQKIIEIHNDGFDVVVEINREGLSERNAYKLEKELISKFKGMGITNIVGGTVTNSELVYQGALDLLKRLKSFDRWVSDIDEFTINFVMKEYGSLYKFWDKFRNTLLELVKSNANA